MARHPHRPTAGRLLATVGPTLVIALGIGMVASAQSNSPFASKKKKQAWEVEDTARANKPASAPVYAPPAPQPYPAQTYSAPSYPTQNYGTPARPASEPVTVYPSASPARPLDMSPVSAPPSQPLPVPQYAQEPQWGAGYGAPRTTEPSAPQGYSQGYSQTPNPQNYPAQNGYAQNPYPRQLQGQSQSQPPNSWAQGSAPQAKRSWAERLGFGTISTLFRGGARGGVAVRESDGWEDAFIGDADLEFEVSAVTDGGLEYGVNLQGRAQYDEGRRGFTRRLPDCPPTLAGCASVQVNGVPVALRGHTSQFYSFGPDVAKDTQAALESAHLFLRSAYGDVTIGRDDGAAYLFSLGAPTLLNVGASNSPVDYTGLDAVKTVNDASGFAEKMTYTTPRLLGDRIGVGVQLGVSYALDPNVCGVDYCVDRNDITDVLTPDLEDVIEVGLSLDRTFANGLAVEATGTYARGSEVSGLTGFDDLESYGAGIEVRLSDWTAGGSWLQSNQGVLGGDYQAYDVGLTWKPGPLGFTLGYGHASDDLVSLTSDQITGGVSYDWNDNITIGAGVQYSDRESLRDIGGVATLAGESATALFIEGGITF